MPQLRMLALCFLFKGLENQGLQHLDTRRWFPQTASDSTSNWGKKRELLQSKDVVGGGGVPDEPKEEATCAQEGENVPLPKQQNKTNGDSGRR